MSEISIAKLSLLFFMELNSLYKLSNSVNRSLLSIGGSISGLSKLLEAPHILTSKVESA